MICRHSSETTHLDASVQGCGGKLVVVLGVDDNLHDVVRVSLKHLGAGPLLVPVPQLDQHVVCIDMRTHTHTHEYTEALTTATSVVISTPQLDQEVMWTLHRVTTQVAVVVAQPACLPTHVCMPQVEKHSRSCTGLMDCYLNAAPSHRVRRFIQ